MRKTLLLAVLTLSFATSSARAGDDDLFSKVRLDSTSASGGTVGRPDEPSRERGAAVSNTNALQSLLLAAGYSARIADDEAVAIELTRSDWSATVGIMIADGGRQLRLAMKLTDPDADTVIGAQTLRGLLEANRVNWGAFFAVTGDPQHIELVKTLANDGLTAETLRTELDLMAEMAEKTKSVWNVEGVRISQATTEAASTDTTQSGTATTPANTATTPATSVPATSTPPVTNTTPAAAMTSLNGKWIATPTTNEAFALQLDVAGSFRLVHVKGTTSTKSKGTFTLAGTTLTLKGDDANTITGTVTRQKDGFTLAMNGNGGKSVTLTFKTGS